MTNLGQFIMQEIAKTGPISFARFMELALYCPDFGYYDQTQKSPGRTGDFYTSVSVGELFGQLLACQCAVWLEELAADQLQIVEAGAHDGRLAADILKWLSANRPKLFDQLEYWILEPSLNLKRSQETTLEGFRNKVRWFDSWNTIPCKIRGVIFGNELLDAMPVRRLGWDATLRHWFEWGVVLKGDEFAWTKLENGQPIDPAATTIGNLPAALLDVLPDGFTTEDSTPAVEWWRQAAEALESGKLFTIDYGLSTEEFFAPARRDGTLRAYYRHRQSGDVLARSGEQDITAQVNFTAIQAVGEAAGLSTEKFTTQSRFLTGIIERAGEESFIENWTSAQTSQFQTLTHPDHLGLRFRVLIQSRQA